MFEWKWKSRTILENIVYIYIYARHLFFLFLFFRSRKSPFSSSSSSSIPCVILEPVSTGGQTHSNACVFYDPKNYTVTLFSLFFFLVSLVCNTYGISLINVTLFICYIMLFTITWIVDILTNRSSPASCFTCPRVLRCIFLSLSLLSPLSRSLSCLSYISSGLSSKNCLNENLRPIRFICAPRSCELKLVQYSTPMCNVFARVHIYIYIFLFVCIYIFIYIDLFIFI